MDGQLDSPRSSALTTVALMLQYCFHLIILNVMYSCTCTYIIVERFKTNYLYINSPSSRPFVLVQAVVKCSKRTETRQQQTTVRATRTPCTQVQALLEYRYVRSDLVIRGRTTCGDRSIFAVAGGGAGRRAAALRQTATLWLRVPSHN